MLPSQCRILKWDPEARKVSTVVQITFDLTAKRKLACNVFVEDKIVDAICGSKTDFWKVYWYRLMDLNKEQIREQSLSHIEGHDDVRETKGQENWKYPPLKLLPDKNERIDLNQPLDYPYDIIIRKMSKLKEEFADKKGKHNDKMSCYFYLESIH